jgi:MFS family permease
MTYPYVRNNVSHNLIANILDGSFFGFALGFASFVTVLPLFVSTMTKSAILIGLIPAIHSVGWQFPQLLTAYRVSRQSRYKQMVVRLTLNERLPFLGLAIVAFLSPALGVKTALTLTFLLLVWQGLGGGFTATAWQSMIAKIFPPEIHGTFYGIQSSAANLLASLSAVLAGFILQKMDSPQNFTVCFLLASFSMVISWGFLAMTREAVVAPAAFEESQSAFRAKIRTVMRQDINFRWFLVSRMLAQFGIMAFAFYTVYAVTQHNVSATSIGLMTAVFLAAQILANPIMGWLGDNWSHRSVLIIGMLAASASALLAWWAPEVGWFYLVFIFAGIGNVAVWTVSLAMILRFGNDADRPVYIGLANTLVAPATILAPLLAGWLIDFSGYSTAFLASALGAVVAAGTLYILVKDPD